MGHKIFAVVCSLIIILNMGCSANLLESVGNQGTDEALFFKAQQAMNDKQYSLAIAIINTMTTAGQEDRDTRLLKASAFGGLCGFEFLSFLEDLSDGSSSRLFVTLLSVMRAADSTALGNCESAFDTLQLISSSAASRNSNENTLMMVTSLALLGATMAVVIDTNDDGTAAETYDHCTDLSDTNMNRMVSALAETIASLSSIGTSIGGLDTSDVTSVCSSLSSNQNFCAAVSPSSVTADQRQGMKGFIGSDQNQGLGSSNNGDCTAGETVANCVAATGC